MASRYHLFIRESELIHPPRQKKRKGGRANIGQVSKRFYIDVGEDEDENEDEDVYKPTVSKAESRAEVQRKKAVLCMVNVNTRFAFARVTEFTPTQADKGEKEAMSGKDHSPTQLTI